jgi:predicted ATPase
MSEIFIKNIEITGVRNLSGFKIPLSDTVKKNLIVTGKNGSGKTTLLRELKKYLSRATAGQLNQYQDIKTELENAKKRKAPLDSNLPQHAAQIALIESDITSYQNWLNNFGGTIIEFNNPLDISNLFTKGDFIVAFFEAKRNTSLKVPTGINRIQLKPVYQIGDNAGNEFIQYIVNLKADRSFAKDDNDNETVLKIDKWFLDFENNLFDLFDNKKMQLQFDRKLYNFNIIEDLKEPYNLNQLSDGYSAILSIVTELIMRMEEHKAKNYDVQGIVLIDEIETHLHIDLQKKVLPFLISFFPKIQFIVTTHSPFVLSSVENTVICDLEKRIVTTDLTGYSYDTLVESYFDSDKYSQDLKGKIEEYEKLTIESNLDETSKDKLLSLKNYFNDIPKFLSDELAVKLQQIKLKNLK